MYPSDCEITEGLLKKATARQKSDERGYAWKSCLPKAKPIKLLMLDVDGILTDGSITYTDEGSEIKTFHVRDGFGMNQLKKMGIEIVLVTARRSQALLHRAQDLSLDHVHQGVRNKIEVYDEIIEQFTLQPSEIAYMGDDWIDLPLLTRVGLSATVADGAPEVRQIVDYVTRKPGGKGAVRELCDLIIEAKGLRETILKTYIE